ncbi:hypothetical protein [Streptomyces griseoluteus]|uniref:hypothetical protein n=1 Tax=Streptomyces griseoluteus TaxID=29306 RepID=UPI0038104497
MTTENGVTTCASCFQRIRWAITVNGRRQPVNAEPDASGNLAVYTDGTSTLRARVLTGERPTLEHHEWRAMPHAATCKGTRARAYPKTPRRPLVRRGPWQQGWQR